MFHPKCIDYIVYSLAMYQYSVSRRLDDVTKKVCKAVSTCRLQLSGLCQSVSSSQEVKCQKRSAICEMINMLFVIGIYHVPPAALVPVSGISGAGHLSAFLSAHQFLRAGSSIGAWIDQNLSMSLKIKWKHVQKYAQCNLDLVTTCDIVTILQRPYFNLLHKIIRCSDILWFGDSFCGDQKCH